VSEKILAAIIGHDETITLFGVEPLNDAGCHGVSLNLEKAIARGAPDHQGWERKQPQYH
jgi:hypothetical protein